MLSKTSIVILGLISEENLSAYDILKRIDERRMKYWMPIGDTTVYETALRLEKKKYITVNNIEHKKSIYAITEEGKQELLNTISELFLRVDYDTIWFSLATMFCHLLDLDKYSKLIIERERILQEYLQGTKQQYEMMKANGVMENRHYAVQRMIQVIELELETINNMKKLGES